MKELISWFGTENKDHSPVAMPHDIPAQPLGQVRPDPVQFLRGRHGVEGQLLHVRFTEAILQAGKGLVRIRWI